MQPPPVYYPTGPQPPPGTGAPPGGYQAVPVAPPCEYNADCNIIISSDQEISVLIRLEKVEKDKTPPGSEVWLVAQNLPKVVGESPQQAHEKVSELFEIMGVGDLNIVQCFRTGRSDSLRYIPVMKIELDSKDAVQRAIMAGPKLQRSIFSQVFVRESRPQWVRNQDFNIRELARRQGLTLTRGRIQQDHRQGP